MLENSPKLISRFHGQLHFESSGSTAKIPLPTFPRRTLLSYLPLLHLQVCGATIFAYYSLIAANLFPMKWEGGDKAAVEVSCQHQNRGWKEKKKIIRSLHNKIIKKICSALFLCQIFVKPDEMSRREKLKAMSTFRCKYCRLSLTHTHTHTHRALSAHKKWFASKRCGFFGLWAGWL